VSGQNDEAAHVEEDASPVSIIDIREVVLRQLQAADEATPTDLQPDSNQGSEPSGSTSSSAWLWLETAVKPTRRSKAAARTDTVDTITRCGSFGSLITRHSTQSPSRYLGQPDPTRLGLVPCVTLYREGTAPSLEDPCYRGVGMEWWTTLDAAHCTQLDELWMRIVTGLCMGELRDVPCARVVDSPHNRKRRVEVWCCKHAAGEVREQLNSLLHKRFPHLVWQVRQSGGAGKRSGVERRKDPSDGGSNAGVAGNEGTAGGGVPDEVAGGSTCLAV